MRTIATLVLISGIIFCLSCEQQDNTQVDELKHEVSRLEKRVEALEQEAILKAVAPVKSKSKKKAVAKRSKSSEAMGIINLPSGDLPASSSEIGVSPVARTSVYDPPPAAAKVYKSDVSYSSRCQAITKKGTQCKRTTTSGRYCWQH